MKNKLSLATQQMILIIVEVLLFVGIALGAIAAIIYGIPNQVDKDLTMLAATGVVLGAVNLLAFIILAIKLVVDRIKR